MQRPALPAMRAGRDGGGSARVSVRSHGMKVRPPQSDMDLLERSPQAEDWSLTET
jgi:hypothetical protein